MMKKFVFAALIAAMTFGAVAVPVSEVKAQSTNTITRTITSADTITWPSVGSKMRGLQYTYVETTGASAGKVYIEGTINGTWFALDSITLADVTQVQSLRYLISASTGTQYKGYRFRNQNTSSATGTVTATYLRRTDD